MLVKLDKGAVVTFGAVAMVVAFCWPTLTGALAFASGQLQSSEGLGETFFLQVFNENPLTALLGPALATVMAVLFAAGVSSPKRDFDDLIMIGVLLLMIALNFGLYLYFSNGVHADDLWQNVKQEGLVIAANAEGKAEIASRQAFYSVWNGYSTSQFQVLGTYTALVLGLKLKGA